jgi:pentatricopeptide repeat protein
MLHTLGELKQHDQVLDMYAEMLQKGVRPDGVTFSVLIGAAGRALNLDKAWDHFRECQTAAANASTAEEHDELRPSAITYINLINACEQCGRLDRAFDVFGEMQSAGFTPNSETYCALLHACVEARHEEKVGLALPAPRTHARPAGSPSPWWCPQWTWLLSGRAGDPKVAEVLSELQAKNVQIEPEGITHPPAVHDATQRSHR